MRSITYVEDNHADALLLEEAFRELRYDVELLVIPDGEQALRYLQIKASADVPPPDLILLDLHLPRHSGAELLAFLRATPALREVPTFLFAPSGPPCADALEGTGLGAERCLRKATTWGDQMALARRLVTELEGVPPA